jgi:predicted ATPase
MAKIEGIRIKNFKVLKDVALGCTYGDISAQPLTPLAAVIGKNGVGKSTLFDAFGFLADCLKLGVEGACDARGRGGFGRIVSQGQTGPIEFEILYRENKKALPITYILAINVDRTGRPCIFEEYMFLPREKGSIMYLRLKNGKGVASSSNGQVDVKLEDKRKLGIATLGAFEQYPEITAFRKFLEGWYLSYFAPDAARGLPFVGTQKHLNERGDNLGNVVQFMEREHKKQFKIILERIADRIPGIDKIETQETQDGRLLLCFNDKGFKDPFNAQQVSDGTLKLFAYLLLLQNPAPAPFICIEEPENGLYHKLLEILAEEFREHTKRKGGPQVFITTHQPYFVNALDPEEVWILEKGTDGFATARRASDNELVKNMVEEGLPLGGLWYSEYLDAR